jgi:hypothetical protein
MRAALHLPGALKRSTLGALMGLAVLAVVTAGGAVSAPAAHAQFSNCRTAGEVYLTQPGQVFSSRDPQHVTYTQGTQSFRLGGNGIKPGTFIDFFAFNTDTGQQVGFIPGRPAQYPTRNARSNCVVNEEGPFTFTLPPGNYRIQANVFLGAFAYNYSTVNVVYLHVLPAPPPPPPFEDPCGPFGCGWDIG